MQVIPPCPLLSYCPPPTAPPPPGWLPSFRIVYFIFVLLGICTRLPWNVLITEKEFYDVRLRVPPFNAFVVRNFMNVFACTFNIV